MHKIAGAAAERGYDLEKVKRIAEKTAESVKSLGFALTSCTVPAKGTPTFHLEESEMEFGVGIHGEPGIAREKLMNADELAKRIADSILAELKKTSDVKRVALLVNGFGGTPLQELYLFNYAVSRELLTRGIIIVKEFVGNYMTSIDMAGASVSILSVDSELEDLLNDACCTPGIKLEKERTELSEWVYKEKVAEKYLEVCYAVQADPSASFLHNNVLTLENIIYLTDVMSACIIQNEIPFCELDSHAGDGDFGMSIAKGFRRLKDEWSVILEIQGLDIGVFLQECSMIIMEYCGGASGPIWGSAFRAAGKYAEGKRK